MGGKLSRAAKVSSQDSDTDLFDQNLTAVNAPPQTTSNANLPNSGSPSGNQQVTAIPVLRFSGIGTPRNSSQTLTTIGVNPNFNDQNSVSELNENMDSDQLTRQNSTGELMDIENSEQQSTEETSTSEDLGDANSNSENANRTSQVFIPAYKSEEALDNADASMESLSIPAPTSISAGGPSSNVDQTLPNVTSTSAVELLHSSESKTFQDGVVSRSSSSNSLSSEQLIQDIEEYNNQLKDSSTDLSNESSETSTENEMLNSDMEELTESQEDIQFQSSLKEMMDKATTPGDDAVVSSDTQCYCLTSGDQTFTESPVAVAAEVARNCISEGDICQNTDPISAELNNKRKNDEDGQDETQSKRLALDVDVSIENDVDMAVAVVDMVE